MDNAPDLLQNSYIHPRRSHVPEKIEDIDHTVDDCAV